MLQNVERLEIAQGGLPISNRKRPLYSSLNGCSSSDVRFIPRAQLYIPESIPQLFANGVKDKSYLNRKRGRPRKYSTEQEEMREYYWNCNEFYNSRNSRYDDSRNFHNSRNLNSASDVLEPMDGHVKRMAFLKECHNMDDSGPKIVVVGRKSNDDFSEDRERPVTCPRNSSTLKENENRQSREQLDGSVDKHTSEYRTSLYGCGRVSPANEMQFGEGMEFKEAHLESINIDKPIVDQDFGPIDNERTRDLFTYQKHQTQCLHKEKSQEHSDCHGSCIAHSSQGVDNQKYLKIYTKEDSRAACQDVINGKTSQDTAEPFNEHVIIPRSADHYHKVILSPNSRKRRFHYMADNQLSNRMANNIRLEANNNIHLSHREHYKEREDNLRRQEREFSHFHKVDDLYRRRCSLSPSNETRKFNNESTAIPDKLRRQFNGSFIPDNISAERQRIYSEIMDLSSYKSYPSKEMIREDLAGCLECYYESSARKSYHHGHFPGKYANEIIKGNSNDLVLYPYRKFEGNWLQGRYLLEDGSASNPNESQKESVPVIIDCFSLSGRDRPKVNGQAQDKDKYKSGKAELPLEHGEENSTKLPEDTHCQENGTKVENDIANNKMINVRNNNTKSTNSPLKEAARLTSEASPKSQQRSPRENADDIYKTYFSKYYENESKNKNSQESQEEVIVDVEGVNEKEVEDDNKTPNEEQDEKEKRNECGENKTKDNGNESVEKAEKVPYDVAMVEVNKRAIELEEYDFIQSKTYTNSPAHMDHSETWPSYEEQVAQDQDQTASKGYACAHCGREFTHLSSLNNHVRTHTGQKPFKCKFCGKRFAQSGVLTAHLRTHTGDRPFECIICKKRFAQTTTLANHIRTHTGQKPFSCKYCKRKFAQSSTRNKHELSHTKEKPYVCKYCGRSFSQSATVTRHMRIHLRQEAFVCLYCGKEFPFLYALDKHLDTHNRQDGTR